MWTHYENLQVRRTASQAEISAAYRAICVSNATQLSPGSDAERALLLANAAYQVLSDPDQRSRYDEWVRDQEWSAETARRLLSASQRPAGTPASDREVLHAGLFGRTLAKLTLPAFIGLLVWLGSRAEQPTSPSLPPYSSANMTEMEAVDPMMEAAFQSAEPVSDPAETSSNQAGLAAPPAVMPEIVPSLALAPDGQPWPRVAGYLDGTARLNDSGLSTVTIDNASSGTAKFVKLVEISPLRARPVRQIWVLAGGGFTLEDVSAGRYDVRYQDLATGDLARSEAFDVQEIAEVDGTRFSNITMTLFQVSGGNLRTFPISPTEF